jgi:pimeloyl-ACP methyl ester carboxylesterase
MRWVIAVSGGLLVLLLGSAAVRGDSDVICTGDCDYDRRTSIDELLRGVRISIGRDPVDTCRGFDLTADGQVSVDELVGGVATTLAGCPAARFEPLPCTVQLPPGQEPERTRCGAVIVPEDRRRSDGRTVRLPVVVFRSTVADRPADPLVHLSGGPGGALLDFVHTFRPEAFGPLLGGRDFVFFDQRGTGRSRPSLACPEFDAAVAAGLAVPGSASEDGALLIEALRVCHDRLVGAGINLTAYTSAQSALDLRDLMHALGYRQWNLWGASYGTRLALTAMRDTPGEIRSVILDSVEPVQEHLIANFAADFERALDTLVTGCAMDPACDALYPDLGTKLVALVERFNAQPLRIDFEDASGSPRTVILTGDRLLIGLQQALYNADLIPLLPLLIQSTFDGNTALVSLAAQAIAEPLPIAWGMYYSVECGEEAPFVTPEIVAAAGAGVAEALVRVGRAYATDRDLAVCGFWDADRPPAYENDAVVSDIPALVVAGEYDPITRPDYGRLAAATLSRSAFFEIPAMGHGPLFETSQPTHFACAMELARSFLADPLAPLDGSCVAALPAPRFLGT